MGSSSKKIAFSVVLCIVLITTSCNSFIFLFGDESTSPQTDLIGTWIIDASSGVSIVDGYHAFNFLNDDTFAITDISDVVIEQNDMTEITNSSFVGNINVQTVDPDLVGTSTFIEYDITTWRESTYLKLEVYDDDSKDTKFVMFYCIMDN